jgi:hypothetical protein
MERRQSRYGISEKSESGKTFGLVKMVVNWNTGKDRREF